MRALAASVMAALGLACSGSDGTPGGGSASGGGAAGDACGPLRVEVDGKELAGLGQAYGARLTKGTAKVWHVEMADGEALTCDEVLRGGRSIRKGQNVIAADISSDKSY